MTDTPNGDLAEMRHSRREQPPIAGMLPGPRELAQAMRELGIAPAEKNRLTVAALVLAAISPLITILGGGYFMTSYWRGEDSRDRDRVKLEQSLVEGDRERGELRSENDRLKNRVDQIEKDRASRISAIDARIETVEKEVRKVDRIENDVTRQGKELEAQGQRLASGKEDRVRDIGALTEAQTGIRLELNGMKVDLGYIRRALEGRGGGPYGRENQMWRGPPYPPVLRAAQRVVGDLRL